MNYLKVITRDQPVKMFNPGQEPQASFAQCYDQTTHNEVELLEAPTMTFNEAEPKQTQQTINTVNGVPLLELPKMEFHDK